MKAVIYARFSSSKQREASIEDQLRICREHAAREGWEVVAEYADRAQSGRSAEHRPEFMRMIANAGESDVVLVWAMDRFSRDPYDAPIYKKILLDHGVKVVSATEFVPDAPEGMLFERMLEAMAAIESAKDSERIRRGMHGNALKCLHNGVRVFGYRPAPDGRFEADPETAPLVRWAFERRASGDSIAGIARELGRRGARTSRGSMPSDAFVSRLLRNRAYVGEYRFGDVVMPGGMPALVEPELFERVQGMIGRDLDSERRDEFALTGRIFCECGSTMGGTSGKGRHGTKYCYYQCALKCGVRPVRADWIEPQLALSIRSMIDDDDVAEHIARRVLDSLGESPVERERREARKALEDAKRGLDSLLDALEKGVVVDGINERAAMLSAKRDLAQRRLDALKGSDAYTLEDFVRFLRRGRDLDDAALLAAMVSRVEVGPETVRAVLNFRARRDEPAEMILSRVRVSGIWWPSRNGTRIGVAAGLLLVELRRAA